MAIKETGPQNEQADTDITDPVQLKRARREFWQEKFATNVARDRRNREKLQDAGWKTAVVWEYGLRARDLQHMMTRLHQWIISGSNHIELPEPDAGHELNLRSYSS